MGLRRAAETEVQLLKRRISSPRATTAVVLAAVVAVAATVTPSLAKPGGAAPRDRADDRVGQGRAHRCRRVRGRFESELRAEKLEPGGASLSAARRSSGGRNERQLAQPRGRPSCR